MRRPSFAPHSLPVLAAALLLSACGGGDDDDRPPVGSEPQRGDLIESPPAKTASYRPEEMIDLLSAAGYGEDLPELPITPKCSVDIYKLEYRTVDPDDELTPASGALMVPSGSDPDCEGGRPIVLYAHGTSTDVNFDIGDLEDDDNSEGLLIAAAFASEGYIVVAPNYLGYDTSTLGYHPYLNADQQSKDMIDALTAARSALPTSDEGDTTDGGKLFITGYSEGGHVAMATHRALEDAGETVTGSAPMSGPYALAAFGDAILQGQVPAGSTVNLTLLISGYQHAYGDLYDDPTEAFEAQYADGIESLLPSATPISELKSDGKLPADQLFSSTSPGADFDSMTPATTPAELAPLFARGFGTDNLLTNDFRLAYLEDAEVNPDGGFPTAGDGLPPEDPANPLRQALKTNDLRDWTPTGPVLLCAGNNDPTVFYLNTQLMADYWASQAPDAPVTVVNLDSSAGDDDGYDDFRNGFAAAKDVVRAAAVLDGADDDGDAAVLEVYHAGLVAPFCLLSVKAFFDSH